MLQNKFTVKTKVNKVLLSSVILAALGTGNVSANPICASSSSDQDNDGWGWENNASCVVRANSESASDEDTPNVDGIAECASAASDNDNDGWGWENNSSCYVGAGTSGGTTDNDPTPGDTTPNTGVTYANNVPAGTPSCSSAQFDDNNDGWGWENNSSCAVTSSSTAGTTTTESDQDNTPETTGSTMPVCSAAVVDDNNDGWGWENNASCTIDVDASVPTVADTTPVIDLPVKVMAVGDSITHGVSSQASYRKPLNTTLSQAGCQYEFVGSQSTNYLHNAFTSPHEGYTGQTADEFLTGHTDHAGTNDGIAQSMQNYNPDVVLLHIGSNDMRLGQNIDNTLSEIDQIISIIHQNNSSAVVLVANLIPWYLAAQSSVESLGTKIEAYVAQLSSPLVKLVDVRTGYTQDMMISDLVHPNATGDAHIADAFYSVYSSAGLCNN